MKDYSKSIELTQKFDEIFPGGHSNFRCKMDASNVKVFVNKAKGAHVWDVDGNEYIEYNGAMGPLLLGHGNKEWVDTLKSYLDEEATTYGTNLLYGEKDIELAELLIKHIPCAEAVKFCLSGSEAVQLAFRIARAYTGKSRILRFDNMYHGWFDNVMDNCAGDFMESDELPLAVDTPKDSVMYTTGKSPWAREESLIIPYNNFEALEWVFKKYHNEIAMLHFEPMCSDVYCMHPVPGFLEKVRELCDEYNVVMSYDEIVTGFRAGLGGVQKIFGVIPDITTLGKGISGGIPFSAVVGKKQFMDIFRKQAVVGAGTFNGYAFGVQACVKAIKMYEQNDGEILKRIENIKNYLADGMVKISEKHNVDLLIPEAPGMFYTVFGVKGGRIHLTDLNILATMDNDFYDKFRKNLLYEGIVVMILNKWFVGGGHTMEDAEKTLVAFENALVKTIEECK
ncbi:aspartate aminotransferase family protein [Clostridium saccharoperbutylacetonicum]